MATQLKIVNTSNIGLTLQESLQQAFNSKRLALGVFDCAEKLER